MSFDLVPLGSLATFINGDRGENYPKPSDYIAEGIPFLSATDIDEGKIAWNEAKKISPGSYSKLRSGQVRRGDILFCLRGSLGKFGYVENDLEGAIASSLVILRAGSESVARYLRFFLGSADAQSEIKSLDNGSVQGNISAAALKGLLVPSPPEHIRASITTVLESLDGRIDNNRRINQTLEAMAQAIFQSWFVDFDPVKAKIAAIEQGEDPLRAAMRAISGKTDAELDQMPREHHDQLAATAALFPDAMEDSEMGEIPKGWEVSTIGEMVEIAGGATPDTKNESYWNPPEYFWTSPKDLSGAQSPVLLTTERKISTAGLSRIGSGLLPNGTLLMSSRAPIGYLAITQIPVAINQGYIAMLPGGKLPPLYLLMWCQQNMEEIKGQANGSTFMEISKKAFRPMLVINPESVVLDRFIETVAPLFGKLAEGVKESSQLAELRDTLLPKLLSGELHVSDTEKFLVEMEI